MSVLFPHVNKPRKWDYRPIYYDPKKDEMDKKLAELQAKRAQEERLAAAAEQKEATDAKAAEIAELEARLAQLKGEAPAESATTKPYVSTLHRGSFREARENGEEVRRRGARKSNLILWVILLALLVLMMVGFEPMLMALHVK